MKGSGSLFPVPFYDAMNSGVTHPQLEQLQGVVERLTYHSGESGYAIARLKVTGQQDLLTIVGHFADIA